MAVNSEKDEIWNSPGGLSWSKVQAIESPPREEDEPSEKSDPEGGYAVTGPSYVIFGNGKFLVVGRQFYQSKDGRTWQADGSSLEERVYFANDRFISFYHHWNYEPFGVATSKDLVDWDEQHMDLEFKPEWVAYFNGRYVTAKDAGDEGFYAFCSSRLFHWAPADMATVRGLTSVAFGANRFVAVGDSGTVLTSPDGFAWTLEKKPTADNLAKVAYGNGAFVAVGCGSKPLFSRNGWSWESAASMPVTGFSSMAFGNGLFLAAANRMSDSVWLSENGKFWRPVMPGAKMRPTVVFGNGVFLLNGGDKVFRSTDGKRWRRSWPGATGGSDIGFDGRRFFYQGGFTATGYDKVVSTDGVDWNETHSLPEARRENVPAGKGEAILAGPRVYWRTPDSLFEIMKPGFPVSAIGYGNGVFVSVGCAGAIAALKIPYQPESNQGPMEPVAPEKIGSFENRFFLGELDARYLVFMRLTHEGESLSGDNRYLRQKTPLELQGRMDADGEFSLQESMAQGKSTGHMAGRLSRGMIRGEWTNPEGTKRLNLIGMETSDKQMSEMTKRFAALYAKRVGTYAVTYLNDLVGANTLYSCSLEDTGWSCEGSSIVAGQREAFPDGFDPDFDLKMVSTLRVEVKKDLTVELFVKGKSRWVLPVNENRVAYFPEPKTIAIGIKIKEMAGEDSRQDGVFNLTEDEESLSLDGHPHLHLKKIR